MGDGWLTMSSKKASQRSTRWSSADDQQVGLEDVVVFLCLRHGESLCLVFLGNSERDQT